MEKIKVRIIEFFRSFIGLINDNILFCIIMVLLNTPVIYNVMMVKGGRDALSEVFKLSFEIIMVLLIIRILYFRFIKLGVMSIMLILSGVFFLLDVFALLQYGTVLNSGMLVVIMATNPREASEFITMYFSIELCIKLLLIIVSLIGIAKLVHYLYAKINDKKSGRIFLVILILYTIGIGVTGFIKYTDYMLYKCSSFGRYYWMAMDVYEDMINYNKLKDGGKNNHVNITRNDSDIPLVIFILGESTNRNHMGIYGYSLPTTPNLQKLKEAGKLHVFTDVISPHSHTVPVLEKLFTFYRTGFNGRWYEYNNLFTILKESGYKTAWISNQESFGVWGNVGRLYSEYCDYHKFVMLRESRDDVRSYDENVLPYLESILESNNEKSFYVIHLMGTHGGYKERYPITYNKFSANDEKNEKNKSQKEIISQYDNAVLYNDYVVSEIMKKVEDREAIVIYVSDHADDVYDTGDYAGHDEVNGTTNMIEIPMVIYETEKFKEKHPELDKNIASSINRPYMTDDMIHTLLDILKIETDEFDATRSIINKNYDSTRKRTYHDKMYIKEALGSKLVEVK